MRKLGAYFFSLLLITSPLVPSASAWTIGQATPGAIQRSGCSCGVCSACRGGSRPAIAVAASTAMMASSSEPAGSSAATLNDDGDSFAITLNFDDELTASQQETIRTAAAIWDLVITGYQDPEITGGPVINAMAVPIDGDGIGDSTFGNTFAQAAPTLATNGNETGGFALAAEGFVQIDSADIANLEASGLLLDVAFHEIGHAIGIGTLWDTSRINGQVVSISGTGLYTGENGVAAFQEEFMSDDSFAPVEFGVAPGPDNSHWDDTSEFTSNIIDLGLDQEIMSSFLGSDATFLSTFTVQSLTDLGFAVDPNFQSTTIDDLAAIVTGLPGDFNDDGLVNAADFVVFRDNVGGDDASISNAGIDDGVVDDLDFGVLVANFDAGETPSGLAAAATAVPEPMSGMLLLIASLGLPATRRRRG